MSRYLYDTSAYAGYFAGHRGARDRFQGAEETFLDPVVLGELLSGFQRGKHAARNRSVLREFLSRPRVSISSIDLDPAE